MNRTCLFILFLLSPISSVHGQTDPAVAWLEDLDYVVEQFLNEHPNPLHRLTAGEFAGNKQHAERLIIEAHTDSERYLAVREFIASVQDGHSGLGTNGGFSLRSPHFPFRVAKFTDGYFIAGISQNYEQYFGHKIESINGHSMDDVYAAFARIAIADNDFGRQARIPPLLSYAALMKALKIIDSEDYLDMVLKDDNGQSIETRIPSVAAVNFDNYANLKESLDTPPLYLENEDQYYWFTQIKDQRSLYFQFNNVSNQGEESFQQFGDRMWNYIDEHQAEIDKLIIDIRNNEGGSGRLLVPFINHIIKRDYINKSGKIFVLTSNRTYSAAVILITDLLRHCNVIYVGEPPASPSNFFSNSEYVGRLPNSEFWLWVASRQIDNAWSVERQYFSPDIPAPFSSEDFFAGNDPALEQVFYGDNRMVEQIALEDGIEKALHSYNNLLEQNGRLSWWADSGKIENRVNLSAYQLLETDKLVPAHTLFKLNSELFPGSYNVWDSFGEFHLVQDEFAEALSLYQKGLALLDEDDQRKATVESNVNSIGYGYLEQQQFDKAVHIFEVNSKLFPDSANVYDSLGEAYLKGGNRAEALVQYRRSLELDPDNQTAIEFIKGFAH